MAKDARAVRDLHQKNIVKLFSRFDGSKNRRKVFEDFVTLTAVCFSNAVDKSHFDKRESLYLDIVKQYKREELDVFAEMMAEIVIGIEENPDQDFLGEMYMALNFGNDRAGQFFTPYDVCRVCASITNIEAIKSRIDDNGFAATSDPACGAGAMLVAFANECQRQGINYQQSVLFVAQDIDFTVGMMCYIALSLMGCAGYVVIGDSLMRPMEAYDDRCLLPKDEGNVWYTPMYFSEVWQGRRLASYLDLCMKPVKNAPECAQERFKDAEDIETLPESGTSLNATESGQLTFW